MRTLRGNMAHDKETETKNSKSKKVAVDDDIGANGDETTDDEGGIDTPPPQPEDDDDSKEEKVEKKKVTKKEDENEYEVDQIVDMEISQRWKCPVKFRVRWVGYTEKDDTWLYASELSCDVLVQDFLEISGRKPEYERAYETKRKAKEFITENFRQSTRRIANRVTYSELDEDEDEILPSGTKSRKVKTKAERKQMPAALPVKRKQPKKKTTPAKKAKTSKAEIYEVESIVGLRMVKGKEEYKVRWKNYGSKYDSWLPEEELNCTEMLKKFKAVLDKLEKQEDWQVEKILDEREKKGKKEFLIHWKGFESKYDTWEPEDNLEGCKDLLENYSKQKGKTKDKLLKDGRKTREERPKPERLADKVAVAERARNKRRGANISYSEFYEQ